MARLEIDIVAKNTSSTIGAINSTSSALSSLEKKYEEAKSAAAGLYSQSAQLQGELRNLKASFEAGAISEGRFNAESAKLSTSLTSVAGAIQQTNSRVSSLKATIDQTSNSTRSFGNATKQLQGYSNDFTSGIRSANAVSVEFSRIIQDAPYGMQGVANNLQQLTQNWAYYTRAAKEAAAANGQVLTTGGLLRGVLSSMASPANILTLAVSAVTAGWIAYERWQQKAKKATKETEDQIQSMVKALNNVSTALYNASQAYGSDIAKMNTLIAVTRDAGASLSSRSAALKELQDMYPKVFKNYDIETIKTQGATIAYRELTASIISAANARAAEGRIAEKASAQLALDEQNKDLRTQLDLQKQLAEERRKAELSAGFGEYGGNVFLTQQSASAANKVNETEKQIVKNLEERATLQKEINDLADVAVKNQLKVNTSLLDTEKKAISSLDKIAKAIEESNQRMLLAGTSGREKEIQQIENWYSSRLQLAKNNSEALILLQDNMRKEIDAVNQKYDAKELSDGEAMMRKRQEQLAKQGQSYLKKIREDAIKEIDTTISYQRRLFESRSQVLIRELNNETKIKEEALSKWVKSEIDTGSDIEKTEAEAARRRLQIQEDYYQKIEKLSEDQRAMNIVTSFDGSATSQSLAAINDQMSQLKMSFEAGAITSGEFMKGISDLSLQRDQLGLLQSSIDGLSSSFGNLFGDVFMGGEDALKNLGESFKNLVKSAISELVKLGVRQALNAALAKGTLTSTVAASIVAAKATSAAWATPAALVSAANFGANAIAGGAALTGLIASTKALSMVGFRQGGYTGSGGINDVAGVVHGKEFVFDAASTRRIGVDNLRAMQRGVIPSSASSPIRGTTVSTSPQRVDVVVHGEISGDVIKLVNDKANQDFNRYFRG